VLALGLGFGLACTAILSPHDSVKRCGSTEECPDTGDNRYVAVCRFDPNHIGGDTSKVSKVCTADFNPNITCDPQAYSRNPDHPLTKKLAECSDMVGVCDDAKAGTEGCQTLDGACMDGLEYDDEQGACVDPDADLKIYRGEQYNEQAVLDQFCKSFFCDDRFVCDTSAGGQCVICDDTAAIGEGGCAELWVNGELAPVYLGDALEDECLGAKADADNPTFGDC
jgi:hypothetical protein